jgi:hypothetical protein
MQIGTRYLDPALDLDADPDPAFYNVVDPGPNRGNENVRPLVFSDPPQLHFLSLHCLCPGPPHGSF